MPVVKRESDVNSRVRMEQNLNSHVRMEQRLNSHVRMEWRLESLVRIGLRTSRVTVGMVSSLFQRDWNTNPSFTIHQRTL